MRKTLLSLLAVAVLLGTANLCCAQNNMKPVVTGSLAGYDKLLGDIGEIGRLAGNPNLGKGLEMLLQMMTQGKGLAGLDKTRPLGFALLTDGQQFTPYIFIPVTDLKQLIEVAKGNPQLAENITLNDGVYEIGAGIQTIYLQQKGKWAVMVSRSEELAKAPADPLKLLADLPQKYDLAYRVSVKNIPGEYRGQLLAQIQVAAEFGMAQMPGENAAQRDAAELGVKQLRQQMTTLVNQAKDLTLGLSMDRAASAAHLDIELSAQSGTNLAEQLAAVKPGKTNFAGFALPEAAATANWTGTLTDAKVAQMKNALATLRKALVDQLKNQGLSEDGLKQATHLADELCEVLEQSVESKRSDGGLAVLLRPAAVTVLTGAAVADGAKLDKILKELAAEIKKGGAVTADSIKLDVETYRGVRFHTLDVQTPDELAPLVGERLHVIVAIGDDRLFVAAGHEPAKTLKLAIERSEAAAGKEVPPLRITLDSAAIAKFVVLVSKDKEVKANAAWAFGFLQTAGKKNHVTITVNPISQGVRVRLEFEEGLLKALGSLLPIGGPPPSK